VSAAAPSKPGVYAARRRSAHEHSRAARGTLALAAPRIGTGEEALFAIMPLDGGLVVTERTR